jgi:hypothetical protein
MGGIVTNSWCGICEQPHPEHPANLSPAVQYLHLLDNHYWLFVWRMVIRRPIRKWLNQKSGSWHHNASPME